MVILHGELLNNQMVELQNLGKCPGIFFSNKGAVIVATDRLAAVPDGWCMTCRVQNNSHFQGKSRAEKYGINGI
jgi:hypothetical protein